MNPRLLVISITIFLSNIFLASGASVSDESSFCSDRQDTSFIQELLSDESNNLSFPNQGGIAGGGVCWWYSRLERNAAYLAYFSPDKEKPQTKEEVKEILRKLRKGKEPVEIPGYSNLFFFSSGNARTVQKYLNHWQRESGIINQSWIKGITDKSKRKPDKLAKEMDKTFEEIQAGKVVYHKLQIKGIMAHAWLVIDMEKTDEGYILKVRDSNFRGVKTHKYTRGSTYLYTYDYGKFSPYREKKKEEKKLTKTIREHCN